MDPGGIAQLGDQARSVAALERRQRLLDRVWVDGSW
jgi:hypothetical protein